MAELRKTVLVVDSDEVSRDALSGALRRDYRVLRTATGESAIHMAEREGVDVMLLDVTLPGISAIDVLKIIRENYPHIAVVVTSPVEELAVAIEAMRHGAFHYMAKNAGDDAVRTLVASACERQDQDRSFLRLSAELAEQGEREFVVGASRATREIVDLVQRIAKRPATVLILGESGTGKELLARLIHRQAGEPGAPFVAVNLAAIPKDLIESTLFGHERGSFTGALKQQIGKFELASGGTLFLDEVGDLRLDLQAKLLRALQEGEIERVGGTHPIKTNFRLIAATNVDLDKAVREGRFREDLYFRLNIIPIRMPALRDRIEDLPELANVFLRRYNVSYRRNVQGIAESTLKILSAQYWPGNIRELENLIARLVAVTEKEWLTDEDLPYDFLVNPGAGQGAPSSGNTFDQAVDAFARNYLIRALESNGWNITATAKALSMPLSTLKFKMTKLDVQEIKRFIRGNGASEGSGGDGYKKKPGAKLGAGSRGGPTMTADRRRPR
jgi:DNA-binding NtrC family response regulator